MTQDEYRHLFMPDTYIPKHNIKRYTVYRVLGPAGPEQTVTAHGLKEAHNLILGCLDWEVKDEYGNVVPDKVVTYAKQ